MINALPQAPDQQAVVRRFLHHLHNTLVLLGADTKVAELAESPEAISAADVDDLRRYNVKLINATKSKLVNIHKLAVVVGEDD